MRLTKLRIFGALALMGSGVGMIATGVFSEAQAAMGDCTAHPAPPPTTSSSSTSSTTSTSTPAGPPEPGPVIVTAAGAGGGPHVQIWADPETVIGSFMAYAPTFTGGVNVAAGDINGDGYDDIVTGAGPGGGPHVRIFNGAPDQDGNPLLNELGGFFAYDPNFHGGVDVAVGDFNGDSHMDIVTGAGAGGGPHVKIFNGSFVLGATPSLALINQFMAYDTNFHGGVSVAAADMGGGDSTAEVVTGAGPGGGPHVRVHEPDGSDMAGTGGGFMAFSPTFGGGLNVAADCTDGVARIAAGPATQANVNATFGPDGTVRDGGFALEGVNPKLAGVDVALGSLDPTDSPPVQLVTAFSGGGADGDPQIIISPYPTSRDALAGFDAYGVVIRISVAVANL